MIWLISIFGNPERVAEVGALGRLAVVLTILGSIAGDIVFPAFVRIQNPSIIRKRYFQIVFAFAAVSASLIAVIALFPGPILAVLGSQYSHLRSEAVLMAISAVIGTIEGVLWGLNISRAWITSPMKYIPFDIAVLVVLIRLFNLSTVRGVLMVSIFSSLPSIIWCMWFAMLSIKRLEASTPAQ